MCCVMEASGRKKCAENVKKKKKKKDNWKADHFIPTQVFMAI